MKFFKKIGIGFLGLTVAFSTFAFIPVKVGASVPTGVTFLYNGTNASIPANWSENTSYAGRYPLGASTGNDGGTNGGQATHTHNLVSHTHTFSGGASSGTLVIDPGTIKGYAADGHTHGTATSNASTQASGATSNDPPYHEFIFIEPDDALQDIPAGVIGFFDNTDELSASSWTASTTLYDIFPKAVISGGDAGATGGSLDDHTHTTDHTHAAKNSAATKNNTVGGPLYSPGNVIAQGSHTHSVSLQSASANAGNADGLPPYRTLIPATYTSDDLPVGIIGLWEGTEATIPSGWERVSAQDDKFLYASSTIATGGSDTHTHTASSAHNHTASAGIGANVEVSKFAPSLSFPSRIHTHSWTVGNTSANLSANTSKSNYPEYRTTIFIKYTGASRRIFLITKLYNLLKEVGKEEQIITTI